MGANGHHTDSEESPKRLRSNETLVGAPSGPAPSATSIKLNSLRFKKVAKVDPPTEPPPAIPHPPPPAQTATPVPAAPVVVQLGPGRRRGRVDSYLEGKGYGFIKDDRPEEVGGLRGEQIREGGDRMGS